MKQENVFEAPSEMNESSVFWQSEAGGEGSTAESASERVWQGEALS